MPGQQPPSAGEPCDVARAIVRDYARERYDSILDWLPKFCESPIEEMFAAQICASWDARAHRDGYLICELPTVHPRFKGLFDVIVEPQVTVHGFDRDYRADFLASIVRWYSGEGLADDSADFGYRCFRKAVVELDGHDFHERTKEQAARDRSRDRDLMANGYQVLRFTGSEVWKNSPWHAQELSHFLDNEGDVFIHEALRDGHFEDFLFGGEWVRRRSEWHPRLAKKHRPPPPGSLF